MLERERETEKRNRDIHECGARGTTRSTSIHPYVGPGGPYTKDSGGSTKTHHYVGPGSPHAKGPGGEGLGF
jgi:hypothetical protein